MDCVTDMCFLYLYLRVVTVVPDASDSKPDDHQQPGNCSQCNKHEDQLQGSKGFVINCCVTQSLSA